MKFYLCMTPEGRKRLVTRQDEAKKLDKEAKPIDIPVDQAGLKAAFEELFDQITDLEKGESLSSGEAEVLDSRPGASPPPAGESYSEKSNRFEDEFDAMPLAQQLHFAAKAMENARERL